MKKLLIPLLLLCLLLTGCMMHTSPEPTPTPTPTPTPEPTPTPKSPAELAREARLKEAQDGFVWKNGFLYSIDEEGYYLTDKYVGVLYFGRSGRYTSGNEKLDRLVASVIAQNTDASMTRLEKLKAMYDYTRDNIKYVGFGNHELSYMPAHGENGWMPETAAYALENQKGDCYHFAAQFTALARGLGYQAYTAAGVIGAISQEHGWVEILEDDGTVIFCDPETEYSYAYWQQKTVDLFYKPQDEIGIETGLGYNAMKDPFAAENRQPEEESKPDNQTAS